MDLYKLIVRVSSTTTALSFKSIKGSSSSTMIGSDIISFWTGLGGFKFVVDIETIQISSNIF